MSGHSKWSQIKRQKGITDKQRGQVFTKLGRAITIAVQEGGGVTDPDGNFKLRLAIEKARQSNMPKVNIERAIASGAGPGPGESWESLTYEGYGPAGVAVVVEIMTNNRNRSLVDVKQAFEKGGGVLGSARTVDYLFERRGLILIKSVNKLDELMLSVMDVGGVVDVEADDEGISVWTEVTKLKEVEQRLSEFGLEVLSAELVMKPKLIQRPEEADRAKIESFLERLADLDDVQEVWSDYV